MLGNCEWYMNERLTTPGTALEFGDFLWPRNSLLPVQVNVPCPIAVPCPLPRGTRANRHRERCSRAIKA